MEVSKRVLALLLAVALGAGGATYLSHDGASQIASHEGYRLVAYPDPATGGEPWTICRGHTGGVRPGQRATHEQCDRWFAEDLHRAERGVQRHVRVPMKQGEYDAAVSFVFNVGEGNFRTSTLLRKLNAGDRAGSCNQYPRWVYANKMKMQGLVVRRYEEQHLCHRSGPYVFHP